MKIHKFGDLINYERNKLRINIETLALGLCSTTALRRIESGERDVDFFLLERLLGRLGSSINKMEVLQNIEDYELLMAREYISDFLMKKEYDRAEKFLMEYERRATKSYGLHEQYVAIIRGILAEERDGDLKRFEKYLKKAMELTLPVIEIEKLEDHLLCEEELMLFVVSLRFREEVGEKIIPLYGNILLQYVDRNFRDEEIKTNLYSRIAWMIGDSLIKQKSYKEALVISLEAEKRLTRNGILLNLPQFLDRILVLSKGRNEKLYREYQKMRNALKNLYEDHGFKWDRGEVSLLIHYKQRNISIISEILKQERQLRKFSQMKLSENLEMDMKTISRIENGRVLPKKGTIERMLSFFNLDIEVVETRIVTNRFYLLELEREIARLNTFKKYQEAELVYQELRANLSMNYRKNKQYVLTLNAFFDWTLGRKSALETIETLKEAFRITREEFGFSKLGEFILNKAETIIVNHIAVCYKAIGKIHKSIEILEKVVYSFENSKVDIKFRYVPLSLIYLNLCRYYEETNQFSKALELADRSISYAINCSRGDFLGFLIEEKAFTEARMSGNKEKSKPMYRQSYQIRKLMKAIECQKAPLKEAFLEWYGEEIE